MRCGFTVSVWSKEAPDAAANLTRLLSEESVSENLSRELAYFDVQLPLVRAEVALLERQMDLLFDMPRRKGKSDYHWFDKWVADEPELDAPRAAVEKAKKAAKEFDQHDWGRRPAPKPLPHKDALAAADAMRAEIKGLYQRMDKLEDLQRAACLYIESPARTMQPAKEFVVEVMLSRGSVRVKEKTAAFLRAMGLPVK